MINSELISEKVLFSITVNLEECHNLIARLLIEEKLLFLNYTSFE